MIIIELVYFDNAATSFPKSDTVFAAMKNAFYTCGNSGRGGHALALNATETVYDCREALARLFGAEAENVALTSGATLALNMAIKGLAADGDTVLCSTLEHNAVLRPLYALAATGKIKLEFFTPSLTRQEQTLQSFKAALARGVSLAVFTHASNVCGICLPVKQLCRAAAERGVKTIVDCAQTAGHTPIDIKDIGADVICVAGHKGLGGPMGTGALIANPQRRLYLSTVIEGGAGIASREKTMPPLLPERLEAGTANITGIAGLAAAAKETEIKEERESALRTALVKGLESIKKVRLYGTGYDGGYMPIVLFNLEGKPSDTVAANLAEKGICVRGGLHCAPLAHSVLGSGKYGGVRVSIGRNNTERDCELFLQAISQL